MKKTILLFDLDGTLTRSGEGITKCVRYALEGMGYPAPDPEELVSFIGPPLADQFMAFAGMDRDQALEAVRLYRERYEVKGIFENSPYPGIPELLSAVRREGAVTAVASSKPERYVRKILDHFQILDCFDEIVGDTMDGSRSSKIAVIREVMDRLHTGPDRDLIVMIGDKNYDVDGAREAGVMSLAVGYGYGSPEELVRARPDRIAWTVPQLEEILTDLCRRPDFYSREKGESESGTGDDRLDRQLAFALMIDREKNIFRQTHLSGHGRNENDAEHAWHMAVMAYLLKEYANEQVDISRVMIMCLIHDIVEIEAGDTYAYDKKNLKTQKAREDAAKEKLYSMLPDDQKQEMISLFDEFEEAETLEAKFAHAMDNLQPLLLNHSNGGSDWVEHEMTSGPVYERQTLTRLGSEKLYQVTDRIIQDNIKKGSLKE